MRIIEITGEREKYWDLFLLADPSKDMVRRYLHQGFLLGAETQDGRIAGEILTVPVGTNEWEIKNLAVSEVFQGKGLGKALVEAVQYRLPKGTVLLVGTDDVSGNVGFYESCGFSRFRTEPGFFVKNYPEPLYDHGAQCIDMIYLKQIL
ncbi:MAG: GNAT family N-acetyltransferase [Ruminococcaceae bacterium]|nr:GNAT family N-acetyltransferase [Oscillospiraceae bacterium]